MPVLIAALVPLAWLLPNHYPPWLSAWQEGLAIALLALAACLCWRRSSMPSTWLWALGLGLASIGVQWVTGRIPFAGDALMAALYVGLFGLALAVGCALVADPHPADKADFVSALALGTAASALLSTAIALAQWTGVQLPVIWTTELPPGARPYSNLAQPNQFNTAAFLGVCALAVLAERQRIGAAGFWAGAAFLLLGMTLSGSRTAWLQLGVLVAMVAAFSRATSAKLRPRHMLGLVAIYVVLHQASGPLDDLWLRSSTRPLEDKMLAGARPQLWLDMMRAIAQEPWWGHGWQQVTAAQQRVALERPPLPVFFEHFDHAHNIVIDLLIWAGVPVGGLMVLLACLGLLRQLHNLRDPAAVWLMIGVVAVLVHAMLEYPLEYAFFLIPVGLWLGAAHGLSPAPHHNAEVPRPAVTAAGLVAAALLAVVGRDYVQAEQSFRTFRLEAAGIGTTRIESPPPDLVALTQLQAFLEFVRTEARPGMAPQEVEGMRLVSERFGVAPALLRYALASGLNGRPADASRTLARICHIHSRRRCEEGRQAWSAAQQRHAVLRAIAFP
jgi:O-antigen ligase